MSYSILYSAIVFLSASAMLGFIARRIADEPSGTKMRPVLAAETAALLAYVLVRFLECLAPAARESALLNSVAALALAVAALFGIAVIHYIATGTWLRNHYALALLALLPRYGELFAAALWLVIPFRLAGAACRARDPQTTQKLLTILLGSYGGCTFLFFSVLAHFAGEPRMLVEILGPIAALLFLHGGLNLHRDPEHELRFPAVQVFVKLGLLGSLVLAFVPQLVFPPTIYLVFERFLVPAAILVTVIFLSVLFSHFEATSIKTFLFLMIVGLVPNGLLHLYRDQLVEFHLGSAGLRLFSRTAFVLGCLFILKQYLRWGFEMVQSMVMFITAVSSAAIVFAVIYFVQPGGELYPSREYTVMNIAIFLLDGVILCSLPPILVNYRRGTMKLTWAIFTFGIFFEVLNDFAAFGASAYERGVVLTLGYTLLALAFASLWRYTNVMMQHVRQFSE